MSVLVWHCVLMELFCSKLISTKWYYRFILSFLTEALGRVSIIECCLNLWSSLLHRGSGVDTLGKHWGSVGGGDLVVNQTLLAVILLFFVKWEVSVGMVLNWRQKVFVVRLNLRSAQHRFEGIFNICNAGLFGWLMVKSLNLFTDSLLDPTFEEFKITGKLVRCKHMIVSYK